MQGVEPWLPYDSLHCLNTLSWCTGVPHPMSDLTSTFVLSQCANHRRDNAIQHIGCPPRAPITNEHRIHGTCSGVYAPSASRVWRPYKKQTNIKCKGVPGRECRTGPWVVGSWAKSIFLFSSRKIFWSKTRHNCVWSIPI